MEVRGIDRRLVSVRVFSGDGALISENTTGVEKDVARVDFRRVGKTLGKG
jgi:hypothetical protein